MIELITGLPGNAKTVFTIAHVKAWAARENRPVFYSGINFTEQGNEVLNWTPIEPDKWFEAPPLAIVVVDESQRVFRNRSLGQIPPKHVTELETHRHLGIDLVFVTQHPSLIDPAIRKLTQTHRHMIRIWGFEASTVHKWDSVRDNCDKPAGRRDSEQMKWKFDKSIYPLYKSAEAHTMKAKLPLRVKLLLLVPFVLAGAAYAVWYLTIGKKMAAQAKPAVMAPGQLSSGVIQPVSQVKPFDPVQDAKEYIFRQTPRVEGLEHTAPKYDRLTEPSRVPVPAACVVMPSRNRCSCYTQQATPMNVPQTMCIEFARNGFFEEFDRDRDGFQRERSLHSSEVLRSQDQLPISGVSVKDAPNYGQIRVVGLAPAQAAGVPTMPPATLLANSSEVQSRPRIAR
jgi:zona occludens toxin